MALGITIATVPFRSCHGLQEQGVSNAEEGDSAGGRSTPSSGEGCDNKWNLSMGGIYEPEPGGVSTSLKPRCFWHLSRGLPSYRSAPAQRAHNADSIC